MKPTEQQARRAAFVLARLPLPERKRLLAAADRLLKNHRRDRLSDALHSIRNDFFPDDNLWAIAEEIAAAARGERTPRKDTAKARSSVVKRQSIREELAKLDVALKDVGSARTVWEIIKNKQHFIADIRQ